VDPKYSTLGTRRLLFQAFVFLTSSKHTNPHTGWQEPQSDHMNSLHVDKEINSLWLRSTPSHTGYTQGMLSSPYSEKLLTSLQWMTPYRYTQNFGITCSTREGHSCIQWFSGGHRVHLSFMELNT
jgi:hypothetical protein